MMKLVQILMISLINLCLGMSGFNKNLVLGQSLDGILIHLDIQIPTHDFMQKWATMRCSSVDLITKRRRNVKKIDPCFPYGDLVYLISESSIKF